MRRLFFAKFLNRGFILIVVVHLLACHGKVHSNKETVNTKVNSSLIENIDHNLVNQSIENKKEGLWRIFHINGQLKTEGFYKNDLKEGLHKEWDEDGILILEGFYENGLANGLMKWFHEQGHLAASGQMVNSIREGAWIICDIEENGFCIEAYFEKGKRSGIWKIYHEKERKLVWKEQTFKNDKMIFEQCWDKKGKSIEC